MLSGEAITFSYANCHYILLTKSNCFVALYKGKIVLVAWSDK